MVETVKSSLAQCSPSPAVALSAEAAAPAETLPKPVASQKVGEEDVDVSLFAKITGYSWEHQKNFVKIYIAFPKASAIPSENLVVNFTNETVEVVVRNFEGNHRFFVRTAKKFVPEKSSYKATDTKIIIRLEKADNSLWNQLERKDAKTSSVPKFDENKDPNTAMMDMMKNLYQEGDDDMKRMIAKSWMEARNKKGTDPMGSFEDPSK